MSVQSSASLGSSNYRGSSSTGSDLAASPITKAPNLSRRSTGVIVSFDVRLSIRLAECFALFVLLLLLGFWVEWVHGVSTKGGEDFASVFAPCFQLIFSWHVASHSLVGGKEGGGGEGGERGEGNVQVLNSGVRIEEWFHCIQTYTLHSQQARYL